jgi:metal-responsive CopG/Arc/MetJ family transcriptional regulator
MLIIFFIAFIKIFMPTQKPIIPVAMDDDLVKRIDDYRRTIEGNIPSRSEAIRRLIEEALSTYKKKPKK